MLKESWTFRLLCSVGALLFMLITLFPLVTVVLNRSSVVDALAPQAADSKTSLQANYLDGGEPGPMNPDLPLYDRLTVAERRQQGLTTAIPPTERYYGQKTVYLTFDDGPDPDNTPAILKILRSEGVKATFFVLGSEIEKYPGLLTQIFTEGHAIGNHTYSHIYRNLYKSAATYTEELHHADDALKKIIGVRPRITRAPGGTVGSFTKEYWSALAKEGYLDTGWNVSSGDASRAKAAQLVGNITAQIDKNKFLWSHVIILMHDGRGHNETVLALPEIIKLLKTRGFEFRVVNATTPPAW